MTVAEASKTFDLWGPEAFNSLAKAGQTISPRFCLALDLFWSRFAANQSDRGIGSGNEQSFIAHARSYSYHSDGLKPAAYKSLTRELLPAVDKNNPVDAFMFCNAVALTRDPIGFAVDQANERFYTDLGVREFNGIQRKIFERLAKDPQYASTQLGAAAYKAVEACHGGGLHFIPSLPALVLRSDRPVYGGMV